MFKLDQSHIVMENQHHFVFYREKQNDPVLCSVFLPSTSLGNTLGLPLPPEAGPMVVTSPESLFCSDPNVMFFPLNLSHTALIDKGLSPNPGNLDCL